jgi:hypothetical protein
LLLFLWLAATQVNDEMGGWNWQDSTLAESSLDPSPLLASD